MAEALVSTRLARRIAAFRFADLPPGVVAAARRALLDTLGAMLVTSAPRHRPLSRPARLAALALLAAAALAVPAGATHQPDHRFIVLGYVTDERGNPRADAPVVVTRLRTGLQHPTRTEADGFYLVVLHLHDEDQGERLGFLANGVAGEVRARFDATNRKVERGTRVDVRGLRVVENRTAFAETLRAYLAR